ncbi:MAG: IS4 family transposase [Chloroflexota bacterium]
MAFQFAQSMPSARLADAELGRVCARVLPSALIRETLAEFGALEQRSRKLPGELLVWLAIAASLFPHEALERVGFKLLRGLRLIWPRSDLSAATKGAICQARYQLGAAPLARLFRRVCRPLATPDTPGAWLFGLRVVAIDGTTEAVPDTPANARAFGRATNAQGLVGFPLLRAVLLIECGTHAVIDAGVWAYRVSEYVGAARLLRSVQAGMLVLWDRGLQSAALIGAVRDRGAQVLGRVPRTVHLPVLQRLSDGSFLSRVTVSADRPRPTGRSWLVRVIEYTLTDPARPGCGERHRLVTTLLDPAQAPAVDLVVGYHERWEAELTLDEQDTHLRQARPLFRSGKPVGVLQEYYGMLRAHYLVRAVMADAAATAPVPLDPRRLRFTLAVQLVTDAIPEFQLVDPSEHERRYALLLADLRRDPLPARTGRQNPRVLRYRRRKYPPKRPRHIPWPQPTIPFRQSVQLLN